MIRINKTISIPDEEVRITASRSSGPGGQNVNKVSTKVTLRFDLAATTQLTSEQKDRLRNKMKNIINNDGVIVIHEEGQRSQAANRKRVIEKFIDAIAKALLVPKKRIPTKISQLQKTKRLVAKKNQSMKKKSRNVDIDLE